jgi:type IV secretory pathway TraG/TraD family ATPase VirD4
MGQFLKGTEAETLVSEKIEKTAISIKSVLTTYLKSLSYVKDDPGSFSIRRWIQGDGQHNWLFVSLMSDKQETLKPLISMWLDIPANSLMSLTPSDTRRIWMIFGELPSFQRLPYLPGAFAEARKFGGCLVAGMQSISQLRKEYGNHAAEEISNLCNTRIFFRDLSFESAQWASRELGESETGEVKENISYSKSSMRSRISLSNHRFQKQIVSPSDFMHLNDLEAFFRLLGLLPLTKIKFFSGR